MPWSLCGCSALPRDDDLHRPGGSHPRDVRAQEEEHYLKWRKAACQPLPATPPLLDASPEALKQVAAQAKELAQKVAHHLASDAVANAPGPDFSQLLEIEADWRGFLEFQLARVQAVNELGGPRMRVVWHGTMAHLGRLPMWPKDVGHILDVEKVLQLYMKRMDARGKVDGRVMMMSALSHRWERPSLNPKEAHPDTEDNKKALALAEYGRLGTCSAAAPNHKFDYYYWIDYACVNQQDIFYKYLGIAKMPGFIACSAEMIFYDSKTADYEPRAWTRVERMLAYSFTYAPLFVYLNEDYPKKPLDLVAVAEGRSRLFAFDSGTGGLSVRIGDPLGGDAQLTDANDRFFMEQLVNACVKVPPLNPQRKSDPASELGRSLIRLDTEHYVLDAGRAPRSDTAPKQLWRPLTNGDGIEEDVLESALGDVQI